MSEVTRRKFVKACGATAILTTIAGTAKASETPRKRLTPQQIKEFHDRMPRGMYGHGKRGQPPVTLHDTFEEFHETLTGLLKASLLHDKQAIVLPCNEPQRLWKGYVVSAKGKREFYSGYAALYYHDFHQALVSGNRYAWALAHMVDKHGDVHSARSVLFHLDLQSFFEGED